MSTEYSRKMQAKMRKWISDKIEFSQQPHDEMRIEFLDKFPGQGKFFDDRVHELVD